jgi:hypothetical protein
MGVSVAGSQYEAKSMRDGKHVRFGYFPIPEEASLAWAAEDLKKPNSTLRRLKRQREQLQPAEPSTAKMQEKKRKKEEAEKDPKTKSNAPKKSKKAREDPEGGGRAKGEKRGLSEAQWVHPLAGESLHGLCLRREVCVKATMKLNPEFKVEEVLATSAKVILPDTAEWCASGRSRSAITACARCNPPNPPVSGGTDVEQALQEHGPDH